MYIASSGVYVHMRCLLLMGKVFQSVVGVVVGVQR